MGPITSFPLLKPIAFFIFIFWFNKKAWLGLSHYLENKRRGLSHVELLTMGCKKITFCPKAFPIELK